MKTLFVSISLLLLLASCTENKQNTFSDNITFDTLTFEKKILAESPRNVDSIYGTISLEWIIPNNKQLRKDLVRFISDSTFEDFEKYSKVQIDSFEKDYREIISDWIMDDTLPASAGEDYYATYMPISNDVKYLVMLFAYGGYPAGAAHGYARETFYTYRKRDKKWITINNILNLQYEKEINKVLDKEVRIKHKIKEGQALEEAEDETVCFLVDSFFYTPNITIDKEGITFHYGQYEVQCYAGGFYELFVPYEKLKPYLVAHFKY